MTNTCRYFCKFFLCAEMALLCIGLTACLSVTAEGPPPQRTMPYRVIYNQDATHAFTKDFLKGDPITPAQVDRMVDEVAQGGADLMLINPNGHQGRVNYPSRVWQTYWDGYDGQPEMKRLADSGCDYLARALARCRQTGIAPGISVRMNDTHDTPWPDKPVLGDFFRQHPEWQIQAKYRSTGPYATVSALDYRQPEVRAYFFALLRELAMEYKPEVLELDFMRFPLYFPPGEGAQNVAIMTAFVREVHDMLDGHIALFVRMPVTPAAAYDYGLDVGTWAKEGLIEGIAVSAHFNTAWDIDMGEWRRLIGDRIALYAGTDSAAYSVEGLLHPNRKGPGKGVMGTDERMLLGFAAAHRAGGADGVYLFNFFVGGVWTGQEPLFSSIRQLRDPAGMAGKPKTYAIMTGGHQLYLGESDGPIQVPQILETRHQKAFCLLMGSEPSGLPVDVEIVVKAKEAVSDLNQLRLHINEFPVGSASEIKQIEGVSSDSPIRAIHFSSTSDMLRSGRNRLVLRNDGEVLTVLAVRAHIK